MFENLDLTPFGNRIPQFNFEVFRRPTEGQDGLPRSPWRDVRGVALVPGTGEYALATEPVYYRRGDGENPVLNVHNDRGVPDIDASLDQLRGGAAGGRVGVAGGELVRGRPALRALHAAAGGRADGRGRRSDAVAGVGPGPVGARRSSAASRVGRCSAGRPATASVLQAIARLKALGQSVMFYPFILMDIQAGNGLADPWTGDGDQPRGAVARPDHARRRRRDGRGRPTRPQRRPTEVDAFFGAAQPSDFRCRRRRVGYHGPEEWSYRRFILHYAHLCAPCGRGRTRSASARRCAR